jgi:hypothetical protein
MAPPAKLEPNVILDATPEKLKIQLRMALLE